MKDNQQKTEYTVTITETVTDDFTVYANSPREALEIAREKYKKGEFVLEPGRLIDLIFETEEL